MAFRECTPHEGPTAHCALSQLLVSLLSFLCSLCFCPPTCPRPLEPQLPSVSYTHRGRGETKGEMSPGVWDPFSCYRDQMAASGFSKGQFCRSLRIWGRAPSGEPVGSAEGGSRVSLAGWWALGLSPAGRMDACLDVWT